VDYVFVSVDPDITQDPRPDLLEIFCGALSSVHGLQAEWKVGEGPDRTRRVHFQVDSFSQAEAFRPKLNEYLHEHYCPFQGSFISKHMLRITYDFLDRSSAGKLFKTPPVIDLTTRLTSPPPRYIQPIYGLEVALDIKDVLRATPVLDNYSSTSRITMVTSLPRAASPSTEMPTASYLRLGHGPYDSASILSQLSNLDCVSHSASHAVPALLYVLNTNGLRLCSSTRSFRRTPPPATGAVRRLTTEGWYWGARL